MPDLTDHDMIVEMHAVIFKNGLMNQVKRNSRSINKLWVLIAVFIAGTGGGVYGVIELLRGM